MKLMRFSMYSQKAWLQARRGFTPLEVKRQGRLPRPSENSKHRVFFRSTPGVDGQFSDGLGLLTGFTLIESLVGIAVFIIITVSVYQAYAATMNAVRASRLKITATALANEQFEIIRNLPYDDVGVIGGIPNGKIPYIQNLVRDGTGFQTKTAIRNIDDPFDGTIGGLPNDLSPADYRL